MELQRRQPSYDDLNRISSSLSDFQNYLDAPTGEERGFVSRNIEALVPGGDVHATGIGLSTRNPGELAFKIFTFERCEGSLPPGRRNFKGHPIEIEELPEMYAGPPGVDDTVPSAIAMAARGRVRPVLPGSSISPRNAAFAGTLGCFVERDAAEDIFALGNNHVLADIDALPLSTGIVQPGPETGQTDDADIFAELAVKVALGFSTVTSVTTNVYDVALARVRDAAIIERGKMLGDVLYDPSKMPLPIPGMRVRKVGRTTGITTGVISAVQVNRVRVKYGGPANNPKIAVFDRVIRIVGDDGEPFSKEGDSGAVVLELSTGHPVSVIFAGTALNTMAFELASFCREHGIHPI